MDATVWGDPQLSLEKGGSDHSPFEVALAPPAARRPAHQPIPSFVSKDPFFAEQVRAFMDETFIADLPAPRRLEYHTALLRFAGARTRAHLTLDAPPLNASDLLHLNTVARVVSMNLPRLARKMLRTKPSLNEHLAMLEGKPVLVNPAAFTEKVAKLRREAAMARGPPAGKKPIKANTSRNTRLLNLALLWTPFGKRLALKAVVRDPWDGQARGPPGLVSEPAEMNAELARHWGSVFGGAPTSEAVGAPFISTWVRVPAAQVIPPDHSTYEEVLRCAHDSAPGRDGLCYSAWRAGGSVAIQTLILVDDWYRASLPMPLDFNAVTLAFAPKAREEADEAEGVARRPSELRPLAMKLTANKLVCAAWAAQLRGVIVEDTPGEQRGGIHGRQILQNVLDLDCAARSRAIQRGFPGSALVLLDMAAAFPSLAHWWLHSVLLHMKLLAAFRAVVGMMNAVVVAHGTAGGLRAALFCVLAGVQQGCPLSGALYTLATNPLLRAVVVLTRGRATLRAFADDWGCVVSAPRDLKPLHAVCRVAARAANLGIKPAKSVIIPLQCDANCEATRARWRARLRQVAPTWSDFGIQDHGKYLGFWLGPGAPDVFEGLVARCDRIVNTIREAGLPPSIGTLPFNRHCPASMVYFGQLALPSFDLARVTARHLNALLHLPGSSLTRWWSQAASTLGMIRPISYQSTALAALARTAADTRLEWRGQFAALMELARDEAPIAFATSHAQPHSWNRPPFRRNACPGFRRPGPNAAPHVPRPAGCDCPPRDPNCPDAGQWQQLSHPSCRVSCPGCPALPRHARHLVLLQTCPDWHQGPKCPHPAPDLRPPETRPPARCPC